jgi:hypothetical protein
VSIAPLHDKEVSYSLRNTATAGHPTSLKAEGGATLPPLPNKRKVDYGLIGKQEYTATFTAPAAAGTRADLRDREAKNFYSFLDNAEVCCRKRGNVWTLKK